MAQCNKTGNNLYNLEGLSLEDIEIIQEAIIRLFNESNKDEHRNFRTQVLEINRAIDPVLEIKERSQYKIPFKQ